MVWSKNSPKLYWYLVVILLPRVSFARLQWTLYELSRELNLQPPPTGFRKGLLHRLKLAFYRHSDQQGGGVAAEVRLAPGARFPHGFHGVHIAANAVIGAGCTIFQGVTIGQNFPRNKDAPVIGDEVIIGAGANIIGRCHIGDRAKIGAGVVLVNVDVAPGEVVVSKSAYSLTRKAFIYPQD